MLEYGFLEAYKILFFFDLAGDFIPLADSRYCEGPPSLWLSLESGLDKVQLSMSARSFINIYISYYHLSHTGWAIARNSLIYQDWLIYFRFIIKKGPNLIV